MPGEGARVFEPGGAIASVTGSFKADPQKIGGAACPGAAAGHELSHERGDRVGVDNALDRGLAVCCVIGSGSKIVHRPLPENDPKQRQPDISLAQELLGWRPRIALKEGLTRTISYFERLLSDQALRAQLVKEATVKPG
jgi:hypothetical protein